MYRLIPVLTHFANLYIIATIVFSSLTASLLLTLITSSTDLLVRELLGAFLAKSFQSCSSQHLRSCMTLSLGVWKKDRSSLDPADDMAGCHTFSTLAVACVAG